MEHAVAEGIVAVAAVVAAAVVAVVAAADDTVVADDMASGSVIVGEPSFLHWIAVVVMEIEDWTRTMLQGPHRGCHRSLYSWRYQRRPCNHFVEFPRRSTWAGALAWKVKMTLEECRRRPFQ